MKLRQMSVRKFCALASLSLVMTCLFITVVLFVFTGDYQILLAGSLFTTAALAWGFLFLLFFQKKLAEFTSDLCRTLDGMMRGNEWTKLNLEEETLLARIGSRLERLYYVMQENQNKMKIEKSKLQSLVSDISHQTKTPIANIRMIHETLLTRPVTEERCREFLLAMGSQIEKLEFLILSMVKTSRLETGVITLKKKSMLVSELLAAALNGILASLEQKKIQLTVDCPETIRILADMRWTAEALFNLLDNAVKYTPVFGSIRLSVQEWEMYLKIDVADSGRGIPEEAQGAIFRRFYREPSVHDADGVGIGLYLAREIITKQGGYIRVESEVGKGSTFSVFLPWQT